MTGPRKGHVLDGQTITQEPWLVEHWWSVFDLLFGRWITVTIAVTVTVTVTSRVVCLRFRHRHSMNGPTMMGQNDQS